MVERFNNPYLDDLIQIALKNNYDLNIAAEKSMRAGIFIKLKKLSYFPK